MLKHLAFFYSHSCEETPEKLLLYARRKDIRLKQLEPRKQMESLDMVNIHYIFIIYILYLILKSALLYSLFWIYVYQHNSCVAINTWFTNRINKSKSNIKCSCKNFTTRGIVEMMVRILSLDNYYVIFYTGNSCGKHQISCCTRLGS